MKIVALAVLALIGTVPAADRPYRAEIEAWRQKREASLRSEDGWLAVSGLFWLKEGANRVGARPGLAIELAPGSVPDDGGVLTLAGGTVMLRLAPGATATIGGKAVQGEPILRSDVPGPPDVVSIGRVRLHIIKRGDRLALRVKDPENERRRAFTGLAWFPVRESYRVAARFVPAAAPRTIAVPNVLGEIEPSASPGHVVFTLGGRTLTLHPVAEPGDTELFFIFRDLTAGKETYPAGRFLYTGLPKDGAVVLDFNKAYSPPCAYTPYATCPLPPKENRLEVRIEAGEKHTGHH